LVDVLGAGGGVVVVGGVVEQDGVFAHEVVDGLGFFAEGEDVFADGVEAEETSSPLMM
jgi:hypothetical protein